MKEADIEQRVCYYAKTRYGMLTDKFTSPNRRAVPDRVYSAHNGWHFFIEFKATGKSKTVHANATGREGQQWRDHERRRALGHHVYVVDDIEAGKKIIDYEATIAALSVPTESYPVQLATPSRNAVAGHGTRKNRRRTNSNRGKTEPG